MLPTFGPADGAAEEDQLPSASVAALAPRASRGRWVPYAIAGALVGIGLGAVIALRGDDAPVSTRAATPPAHSEPAIHSATPAPPVAPPPAEVEAADLGAAPAPAGSSSPSRPARAHRHHLTNSAPAGSNAVASQPAADPTSPPTTSLAPSANGSAGSAAPANVEWKPTMLLPTDKGSGTTKSP
jgi:hypothetical protein